MDSKDELLIIGGSLAIAYFLFKSTIPKIQAPFTAAGEYTGDALYDWTHWPDTKIPANETEAQIAIVKNYSDFDPDTVALAIAQLESKGYQIYGANTWFVRVIAP